MYLLILGIALLVLKYQEISVFASLEWWQVLIPFGLAVLWWTWADRSGYTKRKAVEEMDRRKRVRQQKARDALKPTAKR